MSMLVLSHRKKWIWYQQFNKKTHKINRFKLLFFNLFIVLFLCKMIPFQLMKHDVTYEFHIYNLIIDFVWWSLVLSVKCCLLVIIKSTDEKHSVLFTLVLGPNNRNFVKWCKKRIKSVETTINSKSIVITTNQRQSKLCDIFCHIIWYYCIQKFNIFMF